MNAMVGDLPVYRNLWYYIRDGLPKKGRGSDTFTGPPILPQKLEGALQSLYQHYHHQYAAWEADEDGRANGRTPPVFIVVCNNTAVSKLVSDYVAGQETEHRHPDGEPVVAPGKLPVFSNEKDRRWRRRPNTILVDSRQLESGEGMSPEFKKLAAHQIDEFKAEYRRRFPGRDAAALTDEDLMREVLNTVGKAGKLGAGVKCVVSMSMLTEGWGCNTVTHNLRTAGVKGTTKDQRITFARLDPFPGEYVHAEGNTDAGTAVRVSVGPEFGTVGDDWIKAAALEAIKGSACELLLVCAFAFEGGVHQQTAELTKEVRLGKLRILPVRMNPDLAMFGAEAGQEVLKKTGSANLFNVIGEPDLRVEVAGGTAVVTIRGVDVFDPTTGAVRSGGTDDIGCWFVDTDYDGQSFFVRHAYFLGAGEPYEKLKKALRAEVDEGEWAKLYSATSQPCDVPRSGKIAVKVIDHFGDEVLKVYPVGAAVPAKATGR